MLDLDAIYSNIEALSNKVVAKEALLEKVTKDIKDEQAKLNACSSKIDDLEHVKEVLNKASEVSRLKAIFVIENTVTPMLQAVLGSKYDFKVKTSILRGKPSVDFKIVTDVDGNISEQDPATFSGGGFVDVISTALRYAFLSLYEGGMNNAAILDEPGRMISLDASKDFADFIKYLGQTFNRQTIMCTHNMNIAQYADRIIEVTKPTDFSVVSFTDVK